MTTWTGDELNTIGIADELEIEPRRRDGRLRKPVTIWGVRVGDDLYVRSYRGHGGVWFRAAQVSHEGRIQAGGVEKDVTFVEETDPGINDQIDAGYRTKYGHYPQYVAPMLAPEARSTTIRLVPRARTLLVCDTKLSLHNHPIASVCVCCPRQLGRYGLALPARQSNHSERARTPWASARPAAERRPA